jgi:GTP pyrophosphokinase
VLKSEQLLEVAKQAGFDTLDELAAAMGFGHVAGAQIVGKLIGPTPGSTQAPAESVPPAKVQSAKTEDKSVRVKGARDLLMQLSRCCNPVPGDRILGYITRGRGLTIHSVDCPNLEALDYDRERLVEVEWDTATPSQHAVKVAVIAVDKTGVLANVSSAIAECHANISRAEIMTREDRKAELDFVVEITDTGHLNRVLKAIERVDGVITARRVRSWQEKS